MNQIKTIDSFLSNGEINLILNFAKSISNWENGGGYFWENRVLNSENIYNLYDKEIGQILHDITLRIKNSIKNLYTLSSEVYPDEPLTIVRWFPGQAQSPHADDMTNTDKKENKKFNHRNYGSVIYLNDNYRGGKTYYPKLNKIISPKPGMLVVHPGTPEYLHGVKRIEGGTRYTIGSFWTLDKGYNYEWAIS